ncbi:hypothetical protein CRYUN_Cryun23aG0092300 [Craigia yunnanensis]
MQKKGNDFQRLGICHRFFNFIMNGLVGRGLKRITLGHPIPRDSTKQGPLDEYARNGVQEPLTSHAKPNGEERVNSKLKDDSDSIVKIHFKQTEELDYWTPVDKIGSSVHPAVKDDKAMEKRNEFTDSSGKKKIPLLNGISVDTTKPRVQGKTEVRIQGEGSTGPPKIIIPITDRAGQDEKKNKAANKFPSPKLATSIQPDASKPMLTALGLNINEISETFIQNTRERMSRNISLMEPEES